MSQENVEIVRRALQAWNRNDWETLMASYAPDVIAVPPPEWPEAESARTLLLERLPSVRLSRPRLTEWLQSGLQCHRGRSRKPHSQAV